jgi:hypothetical protein
MSVSSVLKLARCVSDAPERCVFDRDTLESTGQARDRMQRHESRELEDCLNSNTTACYKAGSLTRVMTLLTLDQHTLWTSPHNAHPKHRIHILYMLLVTAAAARSLLTLLLFLG